jgi:hypothetical protein
VILSRSIRICRLPTRLLHNLLHSARPTTRVSGSYLG